MIAKIFINSAPLLVEPSEQGGAPRLALESQPSNDNFVGTIYFGHWFKGDKGKSAYDLAVQSGYQGSEEQYGLYPIVQGDYAKAKGENASQAAFEATSAASGAVDAIRQASTATQKALEASNTASSAATLANDKAEIADTAAKEAHAKASEASNAADRANTEASVAQQAAEIAETKAELADEKATYATAQGDYAKSQGDYASGKAAQYLNVTVSGSIVSTLFQFTKANFDAVALAINNGAPIFVKFTDNRAVHNRPIDWSGIYCAVWNTALSQIEVQSPNIARGFYLNGEIPTSRGCVSSNTQCYITNGASFDPVAGLYTLNGVLLTEAETRQCYDSSPRCLAAVGGHSYLNAKTNFPVFKSGVVAMDWSYMFSASTKTSVITVQRFPGENQMALGVNASKMDNIFMYGITLIKVIGAFDIINITAPIKLPFHQCYALEEVYLRRLKTSIPIPDSPNLKRECIMYMINNSTNAANVITITLHADALSRLTPEDIALASSRNITLTA